MKRILLVGIPVLALVAHAAPLGDVGLRAFRPIDEAAWVRGPEGPEPHFVRFRCPFVGRGEPLTVDVSADQRYVLLLDGEVVSRGPCSGAPDHWFYQSANLTPSGGPHLIEAVVWQLGKESPTAHLTGGGGFILKASGAYDAALTTGRGPWTAAVLRGTATRGLGADGWAFGVGPQFSVRDESVLTESPDASAFAPAEVFRKSIAENHSDCGVIFGGPRLFRADMPEQYSRIFRPGETPAARTIPAHTAWTNVWDLGDYQCAYPRLVLSGGRGAKVTWGWTEALRDADGRKGNRNAREGLAFMERHALVDEYFPDGRKGALMTVPWWRCGRWCRLTVETGDEPLAIDDVALEETRYPAEQESAFACDDGSLDAIQAMSVRGLEMCMHELMYDCPFYEQQMYGGDVRVSFLGVTALLRDDRLIRHGLGIFDAARSADGTLPMNFPCSNNQRGTTWTLSWAIALGDYARWHADEQWLRERLPGLAHTLYGLSLYENADGLLQDAPGWNYLDWVAEWKPDEYAPPGAACGKGVSSCLNLMYLKAIESAAVVEAACGHEEIARVWRAKAERLSAAIRRVFWDESRGMIADTPKGSTFSEHAQALAVSTDCLGEADRARAFKGLCEAKDLSIASSFFLHYVFEAYFRYGRGDLFLSKLGCWRQYVAMGLKAPLESLHFPRSDCHGFGAHPIYHFHSGLVGVQPASPFFRTVRVRPAPGPLRRLTARTPHPNGYIDTDLAFDGAGGVKGTMTTPVPGTFVWGGREIPLVPGPNAIGGAKPRPSEVTLSNACGRVTVQLKGANVSSYVPAGGREVLFMAEHSDLWSGLAWVNGGIPICWPWFNRLGPKDSLQHGFVRTMDWKVVERTDGERLSRLTLALESSDETRRHWPYAFALRYTVELGETLKLALVSENRDTRDFRLTFGFHPYFSVSDLTTMRIEGFGEDRATVDPATGVDGSFPAPNYRAAIRDDGFGRRISLAAGGNGRAIVWNCGKPWDTVTGGQCRKYVCVEPANLPREEALTLRPGERHVLELEIGK